MSLILNAAYEILQQEGLEATRIPGITERPEQQGFPAAHRRQLYQVLYRPAFHAVARTFLLPGIRP